VGGVSGSWLPRTVAAPGREAAFLADTTGPPGAPRRVLLAALLLGLGVLAVLLLAAPGTIDVADGQSMFGVTRAIVERGDVAIQVAPGYTNPGVPGLHGQYYSKYGPAQSLLAVPLYLLGRALEPLVPAFYRPELPNMAASALPVLATAATTVLLVLCAVELGAAAWGALGLGLIYALATPAAVYATQWFSEPLTALAVLAVFYLLLRDRHDRDEPTVWRPLLAGVALGLAVATRVEALLFAPPFLLYALLPARWRAVRVAAFALPLAVILAGLGLYDAVRFGSPLDTGYVNASAWDQHDLHPEHSLPSLLDGLYGLLLSPGKGLLEYAPVTLLAPLGAVLLWARRRAETALLLGVIGIDTVAHANVLIRWLGGWSWGPRFLIPVLPLALLLLVPLLRPGGGARTGLVGSRGAGAVRPISRRPWPLLAGLAALGALVQLPALVVHEPHIYIWDLQPAYGAAGYNVPISRQLRLENAYVHDPALSPILGSWRLLGDKGTWTPATARAVAPANVARKSESVAPHTWWRLLYLQGAPAGPLYVACALLAMLALFCLAGALRVARPKTPRQGSVDARAPYRPPWSASSREASRGRGRVVTD